MLNRASLISAFLFVSPMMACAENAAEVVIHRQADALQELRSFQRDYWEHMLRESPELATFVGCPGEHGKWTDFSEEAFERRKAAQKSFYLRLKRITKAELPKEFQIQYDIVKWLCEIDLEAQNYPYQYLAMDQLNGIHLAVPMLLQVLTQPTHEGYEALIQRIKGVPALVDQHIELMKRGIKAGIVAPKIVMRSIPNQIAMQIEVSPADSVFFQPFLSLEDKSLQIQALQLIQNDLYPAFEKLHSFVVHDYIPACRETVGFCDLPNGRAAYAHLVKMHTTTELTPQEIHAIGLAEVNRVWQEMLQVVEEVGFHGSVHEFAQHLKQNASSYYTTKAALLQGFRDLLTTIECNLHKLFKTIPTLPCEVVAVPEYAEASSIVAYYYPGSVETGRPGQFFANTYNLLDHPKWMMESLTLHEALPGHHFQISLAQVADIPFVQKHSWTTAFVEGWGLYSESLGRELGLYQNPYSYFGRLVNEMMRALRLVVDTGLHELSWTRQQAIDYFKAYLPVGEREIINEIDRYIVMPGQALSYKIGELKLLSIRAKVAEKEGDAFDIRDFHDTLLQLGGCLPLKVLEDYFLTL